MGGEVVIFDLDNTLVDCRVRYYWCELDSRADRANFWECLLSDRYMDLDIPKDLIKTLRTYYEQGYRIIIITERLYETQYSKTIEQLKKWNIPYHEIYFRRKGDYRNDFMFKSEIIKMLLDKGYKIKAVYDDSIDVVQFIRKQFPGIEAYLVV